MSLPTKPTPPGGTRLSREDYLEAVRDQLAERLAMIEDFHTFAVKAWPVLEGGRVFQDGWAFKCIAEHLELVFHGKINRLLINMPPRLGKPVDENAYVYTGRGVLRLKDIVVGDTVLSHLGRYCPVTEVHVQGELPTLTFRTERRREISMEKSHVVLTPDGWKESGSLIVGDVLGSVMMQDDAGDEVADEEARLLGYLVGDGACQGTPRITACDQVEEDDIRHCIKTVGFNSHHHQHRVSKTGRTYGYIAIRATQEFSEWRTGRQKEDYGSVRQWMTKHDLWGKNSYTKEVPSTIMAGNKRAISEFIGAYWACDGHISNRGKRCDGALRDDWRVGCDSVSKKMMEQVQLLLQKLGINSRIRKKVGKFKTKKQGDTYTSYALEILTQDDCYKFASQIKMHHSKQKTLDDAYKLRFDFDRVIQGDPIVAIENGGVRNCRCLTVEGDHSFVANGIAVHNSSLVSVLFPVWCWLNQPSMQFMTISYSEKLAMRDNVRARRLIRSAWFQERFGEMFQLSDDQDTKIRVDNMQGGYRVITSVDGTVTGEGSDCIIADDLNSARDTSETSLSSTLDFFTQVLPTRFNDFRTGRMVVVQQRVDERDVSGHILASDKEGWTKLILPMEFEPGRRCITVPLKSTNGAPWADPRMEENELLVPSRMSRVDVDRLKKELASEYAIAGQLQQRPAPLEGGIIKRKWIKIWKYPEPPVLDYVLQSWDTAMTDGKHSAYTAVTTWGVFKDEHAIPNVILLSAFRKKMEFPEVYEAMLRMSRHYLDFHGDVKPVKGNRFKPDIILVEDKASGVTLIQQLRRLGIDVIKFNPNKFGDKINRVRRITHLIEAGRLWVPGMAPDYTRLRPYADMLVENLVNFPNAETRDITDTVAQALLRLSTNGWIYHPLDLDAQPVTRYAGEDERPALY